MRAAHHLPPHVGGVVSLGTRGGEHHREVFPGAENPKPKKTYAETIPIGAGDQPAGTDFLVRENGESHPRDKAGHEHEGDTEGTKKGFFIPLLCDLRVSVVLHFEKFTLFSVCRFKKIPRRYREH